MKAAILTDMLRYLQLLLSFSFGSLRWARRAADVTPLLVTVPDWEPNVYTVIKAIESTGGIMGVSRHVSGACR